jgi:hypothetical protein
LLRICKFDITHTVLISQINTFSTQCTLSVFVGKFDECRIVHGVSNITCTCYVSCISQPCVYSLKFSERIKRILEILLRCTKFNLALYIYAINITLHSVCLNMPDVLLILQHSWLFLNKRFISIISELEEYKVRKIAFGRPGYDTFKDPVRTAQ